MTKEEYIKKVDEKSPKSNVPYNCFKAFWVGGTVCTVGEVVRVGLNMLGVTGKENSAWCSVIMVFLGAFLTGLGIYDKIGKYGGAGALVPITGFANGITSPAMEFKTEGLVAGLGAKMFIIAGPVIVYGVLASTAVGAVYLILQCLGVAL